MKSALPRVPIIDGLRSPMRNKLIRKPQERKTITAEETDLSSTSLVLPENEKWPRNSESTIYHVPSCL